MAKQIFFFFKFVSAKLFQVEELMDNFDKGFAVDDYMGHQKLFDKG